jgi:hypothetical protein
MTLRNGLIVVAVLFGLLILFSTSWAWWPEF